ncbi:Bug family tripartite tricarboxylate transporter substrate binding protein [Alcaligenes endophyticus]|uniref:Tripartite tricarboxylate transporter substrate binding protein n=1 Tax=Alcaligenes endophyticus TaxID=1929088 RepID=A0ABT8EMX5_9BURK|nr:tripartite tricarboxylate transporter substrate binding protein [Alcaligenes endophyticus]MCX5591465.1 tripartite tricarboxylate transporter substrate binding protein [Alcaligenes endophyticus]MDN4122654.1 tripartite tricarboxylate transporter substrate binding protein [Alcaligenes endophyticus]
MQLKQLLACTALVAGSTLTAAVHANSVLPNKQISLVVGFVAGGAADASARLIAQKLSQNIGQSVVIINKPGAGGNIAHQYVAQGPSDGSMLLLGSVGPLTISPHLIDVSYDPFKDIQAISGGVNFPNVLVVHKGAGINTLKDFLDQARSNAGEIEYASSGFGAASHMAGELLNMEASVEMVHVPYKGGAQAMQDLLGERVMSYFAAPPTAMPYVAEGMLIPLATTGLERPAYLPNIPTVAESGYPGFEALNWYSFAAPGKTPEPILESWNEEIVKVLNDPEIINKLTEFGMTPQPTTRQEFIDYTRQEYEKWGKIIKERNLKKP